MLGLVMVLVWYRSDNRLRVGEKVEWMAYHSDEASTCNMPTFLV